MLISPSFYLDPVDAGIMPGGPILKIVYYYRCYTFLHDNDVSWDHYRSFWPCCKAVAVCSGTGAGADAADARRHIEALEANIGAPLFLRSVQGLLPTATALAMRPLAESMEASSRSLARLATASSHAWRAWCASAPAM